MGIAVVVPAYNAAETIGRAVASVVGSADEVIVVDDGSIDATAERAAEAGAVVLSRAVNGGPGAALNDAVEVASSSWVCILGADDYFLPDRIARIERATEGADLVTTDAWVEDPVSGERLRYYRPYDGARWPDGDQRRAILESNFVFGHAAVRRDIWLAHMRESSRDVCEDWPRWARLILAGARCRLIPEPLAVYTLTEGSRSVSKDRLLACFRAAMQEAAEHPEATGAERDLAVQQLASADRQEQLLAMRTNIWLQRPARRAALRVLTCRGERKRHRAEAALALASPSRARRRMSGDPTVRQFDPLGVGRVVENAES